MVKLKASWKGLDREFCCPVTCAKLYNIAAWLTNLNIMQSLDMSTLSTLLLLYHSVMLITYSTCSITVLL